VALCGDDIHIWCASLECHASHVVRLTAILADEERNRVARFRCAVARNEFLVARGLLRILLGHYLGLEPRRLAFCVGPQGKPFLTTEPKLQFNLAHSHGLALFAVSGRCEVGVDVERVRTFANDLGIAERYFSRREAEILRGLEPERRSEAFFHTWARKEAVLKASGEGLALGLEGVEVSVASGDEARLLRVNGTEEGARRWTLQALTPAAGYVGALAVQGTGTRLTCRHWPDADGASGVA
jgi:4'-phosphopantetheinyl transferase